jgi:hypothetical protein
MQQLDDLGDVRFFSRIFDEIDPPLTPGGKQRLERLNLLLLTVLKARKVRNDDIHFMGLRYDIGGIRGRERDAYRLILSKPQPLTCRPIRCDASPSCSAL